MVIEKDEEGYFVASVPALRGCHTQAKSLDTLMKRRKEAVELALKSLTRDLSFVDRDQEGERKLLLSEREAVHEFNRHEFTN